MSMSADSDPRFRRLEIKLALFVGAGVLLGVGLLVGLAVRQGYFLSKTPVYFQAASGSDLRSGMAVKLSGFKIGQVSRVDLNQQARVDVEMEIEDRYMKWVKADSVATLAREGMIGDSFISITSGNPALPPLVKEERLRFVAGSSLGDIALDVRNRIVPVVDELHALLQYANDPRGDVRGSFAELHRLTVELHGTRQRLDETLARVDQLAGIRAPAALVQMQATLTHADASLHELETAVPALDARAQRSLQMLDRATSSAAAAADKAGVMLDETRPRLNGTLVEAQGLLQDGRAAVDAARRHWPFKGGAVVVPQKAAAD